MKTRLDFVSNSSSSSYIISVDDNPHMMVLNNPELLTFRELVEKFSIRLFGPSNYYMSSSFPVIEVSNDEFIDRFMNDTVFIDVNEIKNKVFMPHNAVYAYKVYEALQKERQSKNWNVVRDLLGGNTPSSKEYDNLSDYYVKLLQNIDNAVMTECYNVLNPTLKDMRFCYQEIDDNYRGYYDDGNPFNQSIDPDKPGKNDVEDVMRNRKYQTYYEPLVQPHDECLIEARIEFLEKLNGSFKFKRIFSNH